MTAVAEDLYGLLEEAPKECEGVASLWSWSMNFEAGQGPATAFLDLIGYSADQFGENVYGWDKINMGYRELSELAGALEDYANNPQQVREYIDSLIEAEARL